MNKNKIIFLFILGAIVFITIVLVLISKSNNSNLWNSSVSGDFNIWIYQDSESGMNEVIEDFKALNPQYSNTSFAVVSFADYEEYQLALTSALAKNMMPDIFVLNNNETLSVLWDQSILLPNNIISPNDFRKKYKWIFGDELIVEYDNNGEIEEALVWIPVGYETLWVFYNRKFISSSDVTNISSLNNKLKQLKELKPNSAPFGIWNGSTVHRAGDIISQLFLFEEEVSGLWDLSGSKIQAAMTRYFLYGDSKWDNGYDNKFVELSAAGENNYDLFSKWDTYMVTWYPRDLNIIAEKWYSKNFLLASPFPHYYSQSGKTLMNYNYFALNKASQNPEVAYNFLQYLSSDRWAEAYLDAYDYYLPALLWLESDFLEEKVSDDFNVVLWDFYDPMFELSSFDKGIKSIYDREIIQILDNSVGYRSSFEKMKTKLLCQADKVVNLNLTKSCE